MEQQHPETPAEHEAVKTGQQRAEDIAYTINHAGLCTATDWAEPYIDKKILDWFGLRLPHIFGCGGHDHEHGAHDHHQHDHATWHWYAGELAGDLGAVPVTIALQRYMPGFMGGLKDIMEPALGYFFRKGAERSAKRWAGQQGFAVGSAEYKERLEAMYRYEVDHLPQALMWTVSSIAINLSMQKWMGNAKPLWQIGVAKATGAGLNSGLLVAARSMAPGAAHGWDSFVSRKVVRPMANMVGVDKEDFDRMIEKEEKLKNGDWASRTAGAKAPERDL